MLLDTETAVKVAHDIIHDAKEFLGYEDPTGSAGGSDNSEGDKKAWVPGKWAKVINGTSEDVPEGYVDFEFSDGNLIRMPCVWQALLFAQGAERQELEFKHGGTTVTWKPGTLMAARGSIEGLVSDGPVAVDNLITESILGISNGTTSPVEIVKGKFDAITAMAIIIAASVIEKLTVNNDATITGSIFENLLAGDSGYIDAEIEEWDGDSIEVEDLVTSGEQYVPVEKMNAWTQGSPLAPTTDAKYTGTIPFLPLNEKALPINGFDNPLESNPFFPDWFYTCNQGGPYNPRYVWVPSLTKPSKPAWRDVDGIYWYQARVTWDVSMFGTVNMIYPPRCRSEDNYDYVLPPVPAAADGLVITVQQLDDSFIPYTVGDRYEFRNENEWYWYPGRGIQVRGPTLTQFILKRVFTVVNGAITAVEYQLLPLGDVNGRT